jgi:6,7-dimethyl-8-ribityllumazine synthase
MNQTSASPAEPRRIAAISASWHREIVHRARDAFLAELAREGWPPDRVETFDVPGAFEIPLLARRLAESGRFDAVAGFGLVVDGGIYRHDFVASAVIDGLMRVQLDTGVPVLSAVLTPHHFHEHAEHARYFGEHLVVKGTEAAQAALQTIALHQQVQQLEAGSYNGPTCTP